GPRVRRSAPERRRSRPWRSTTLLAARIARVVLRRRRLRALLLRRRPVLMPLRALGELLEDLARLVREIAERHALALAALTVVHLHLACVLLERREQRDRR